MTTIRTASDADFAALIAGHAPDGLSLPDGGIESPDVLAMLRQLAADIAAEFAPSAWLIVADGEVAGLCSLVARPANGSIHIGYGIAPARRRRGHAAAGVASVLEWARHDPRVLQVAAETSVDNLPSQLVLERCGFVRIGTRHDLEDGALICWQTETACGD